MRHSENPEIIREDEACFVALCDCGWQSEVFPSYQEALSEFHSIHFLANPHDDLDTDSRGSEYFFTGCWFCGHEGHNQKNCPRKPLYKLG